MDKNRLCYLVRSNYPKLFGIRKTMQRLKVKRLDRFYLTEDEILLCEKNPDMKKEIIAPYIVKWDKVLKPVLAEMEDMLAHVPAYKSRQDMEDVKVDMLFCRLAYGFIPSEYVVFELENKSPEERKEFVSDIDTNVFGYSVNDIKEVQSILDKGESFKRFGKYFKRDALVIKSKKDLHAFEEFVQKHPRFVKKKVFSSMGKGTELVNIENLDMSVKDYFYTLIKGGHYLLEDVVVQHEQMAVFNSSSVNTIRCMTFKTTDGVEIPYCFMRTGRKGSFVDNGGSGGLFLGIDISNGRIVSSGTDEYNNIYASHPDSGVVFEGFQIPAWDELKSFCKNAAAEVEGMGYLSWDLAYTENGWDVIEVNEVGQLIGPQLITKRGIKKELEAYFSRMEKVV